MTCKDYRELMPDVAAGIGVTEPELDRHLQSCAECAVEWQELRQTMALMDEWNTPEPSPYFDVRLQARLREEFAKPQAGWMQWFRRPVLAGALAVMMAASISVARFTYHKSQEKTMATVEPGTAVGDLQTLDKNNDMFSDFDVLDDLQVQDVNQTQ
ncbi:MAG: zf-HC2 domain-containing protein [Acidobacteriales bacterium]|nr:zf-HC2 domain-containing protein [Terriglobales bacterium]